MSANHTALVVLAKPPLRGRAKSRLAADLGDGAAARLARDMLLDTWERLPAELPGARRVLARCDAPERYPLLLPAPDAAVEQGPGDLGARMARLLADALAAHPRAVLLGTDAPGRPDGHLAAARAALERHPLVLGPCADGGFWCLAGRADAPALRDPAWLDGLDWSRADTAAQVRARAAALGLAVGDAPPWFDLDHAADLSRLAEAVPAARAPRLTARLLGDPRVEPLSVVLPTLAESERLDAALAALAGQPGPLEVLLADGGSADGGVERALAAHAADAAVRTPPGRGAQLAAGCALATGDALLVLHVDTRLPPGGTRLVREALAAGAHAGAFVIRTERDPAVPDRAGPLLRLADLRSRVTRRPYGDQALFASRAAYERAGGFRPLPIMEDWDLSRRLATQGRLARLRPPVRVSGRSIQQHPLRALVLLRVIPPLFRLGVSPARLARLYRGR